MTGAATASNVKKPTDALACGLDNPSICLANVVYAFTVGLGSGLAYVGGFMFDITVSLSLNSTAYALTFLSEGWTTARDLANMAFILILVYIAFMIMFQAETARTIQMLAWVIFIALIINFSFFFTRVVIDVGNILAVQFYNSIDAPNMQGTINATSANTGALANSAAGIANALGPQGTFANTKDLTHSIMQALNIQELFNDQNFKNFANQNGFGTKFIVLSFLYIMVGACYFILAAMFLAVSIKFIVRIVVLWFLIIISPLAFVCKAILNKPNISGLYDQWQHHLFTHAFYPAFFLFIFFFISTITKALTGPTGMMAGLATDLSKLSSMSDTNGFIFIASAVANVGIRLGFIVAMLYIALKASETLGVKGAEIAHKATSFAFGQTGRLAAAPIAFAGRQTFGRLGNRALESAKVYDVRAKNAANKGEMALSKDFALASKHYGAVGNALGSATYDPRNAPGASILKKGVERITGGAVNTGQPAKGGFLAQAKERAEKQKVEEKEAKQKDREEKNLAAIKELAENSAKHDTLAAKEKAGTITPAERTQKDVLNRKITQIETKVNGLNKSEIESYKMADIQKVIKHLNKDAIKKINESEKYTEKEKETIRMEHDQKMRERAGESAVEKSQETIEELRHIREELVANANVVPVALDRFTRMIQPNATVSPQELAAVRQQLKSEIVITNNRLVNAPDDIERQKARHGQEQLKEALSHLDKIKTHLEAIPENIGGAPNAKEFLVA